MKVRFEDYEEDTFPLIERIQKKLKEERIPPPKEKSKKPIRYKEIETDEEYD